MLALFGRQERMPRDCIEVIGANGWKVQKYSPDRKKVIRVLAEAV